MFNVAAAWAHIDSLAEEHGVTVKLVATQADSEAYIAAHTVYVPKKLTKVNYLVALHELGHVCSDTARRLHFETVRSCSKGPGCTNREAALACEAAAWAWAWEHRDEAILPKIGPKTLTEVLRMLGSHLVNF